jgi:hypothetical protein
MSLDKLLKELDKNKLRDQERQVALVREQYDSMLRAKEEEISALKEEIDTLRSWLDCAALPAYNPIKNRPDALELVKMNFGKEKPCPDLWSPGEKPLIDSLKRHIPEAPSPERLPEGEEAADEDSPGKPTLPDTMPSGIPGFRLPEESLPDSQASDADESSLSERDAPEVPGPSVGITRERVIEIPADDEGDTPAKKKSGK